jgi:hypothetical protein
MQQAIGLQSRSKSLTFRAQVQHPLRRPLTVCSCRGQRGGPRHDQNDGTYAIASVSTSGGEAIRLLSSAANNTALLGAVRSNEDAAASRSAPRNRRPGRATCADSAAKEAARSPRLVAHAHSAPVQGLDMPSPTTPRRHANACLYLPRSAAADTCYRHSFLWLLTALFPANSRRSSTCLCVSSVLRGASFGDRASSSTTPASGNIRSGAIHFRATRRAPVRLPLSHLLTTCSSPSQPGGPRHDRKHRVSRNLASRQRCR